MKKCKENYIKILTAMRDNNYDVARLFEEDENNDRAKMLRVEAMAYQTAIWLLSDCDGCFEKYGKIYFPEEIVLTEAKAEYNKELIDVYCYENVYTEDFTEKFTLDTKEIYKALDI